MLQKEIHQWSISMDTDARCNGTARHTAEYNIENESTTVYGVHIYDMHK